jgi:predicted dehydrogenase
MAKSTTSSFIRLIGTPRWVIATRSAAPFRSRGAAQGFNALAAELEGFAAAINGERAYPITTGEILHGVAAFEAIVSSAALHQPVQVAPFEI